MVGTIYRPPSVEVSYFSKIMDNIESVYNKCDNVILLGDLNYNYEINEELCSNPINYIESAFCMKQLIVKPTRVTQRTSSLIDIILSSIPEKHVLSGIFDSSLSDHKLVYTVLRSNSNVKQTHQTIRFRTYTNFSIDEFISDIQVIFEPHNITTDSKNINEKYLNDVWHMFKTSFLHVSDKHAPIKTMRLKQRLNPWMTNEIIKMMYKRDYIKQQADKNKCGKLYEEYKRIRNYINTKIKQAKSDYFNGEFFKHMSNSKTQSKLFKQALNKKNNSTIPQELTAESFNTFFSEIGPKTTKTIENKKVFKWKYSHSRKKFKFETIMESTVYKYLKSLGTTISSNDVLNMDSKLLSISAHIIAPFVTFLINASLKLGIVLADWKLSRVTPIYKGKGDVYEKGNYRPISVIGHISKALEKQVQSQLIRFLVENDFIHISQSAYRKFHSTQTAIYRVLEDWLDNITDNLITGVCLLDISKCFDTIDHGILLQKLDIYGIDNVQYKWFSSYLLERSQIVVCNNNVSDRKFLKMGIPQGSVLGPLLFLLFSNDLPNNVDLGSCNMFADDTLIYISGKSHLDVQTKLQRCIDQAVEWYDSNRLVINAKKSNSMVINCRRNTENSSFSISIHDCEIEKVNEATYLGMKIDNKLQWTSHVNKLCRGLGVKIAELKHLRKCLNKQFLCQYYRCHIQPLIDYGITIWSSGQKQITNKIQRLQNHCARLVCNNFDYKSTRGIDLVRKLNWMSIEDRSNYFMYIMTFKALHGLAPSYVTNEFTFRKDMGLRTSDKTQFDVFIPPFESNFKERSVFIRACKLWNSLPTSIKAIASLDIFRNECKKHVMSG
jgi:hypothetical protein